MPVCTLCGADDAACGDHHMTAEPITNDPKESVMTEPVQLSEYEYYVGHTKLTAQLTEEQAEAIGASPVGEAEAPEVGGELSGAAAATRNREAEDGGVDGAGEGMNKARTTRNRRAQ